MTDRKEDGSRSEFVEALLVGADAAAHDGPHDRVCPVQAAARALVRRALADEPELKEIALAPAAVVVVEVPDSDWTDPVAEAWRAEVRATEAVPDDGDDADPPREDWLEFRRNEPPKGNPLETTARIGSALSRGRQVYAFSPEPGRCLPADLLRSADRHVVLPRPDRTALVEAMALHHGAAPSFVPDDAEARLVTPGDLLLACRPGRDPDGHLRRALSLASARTGTTPDAPRLEDLHGMDEAVRWGLDLRHDLGAYRAGRLPWRDVDKGVLLAGPTGTGKTTFARALAASCGIPLVIGSLGAWQASGTGHLGDMLKAMRTTFDEARRSAPCILLIDEVDGVGNRATFDARHRDYSVQVLNAMLELLDGAQSREGVVVVAATNRPDAIDPALLRPGRLDRIVGIGLPDAEALTGILRHHLADDLKEVDVSWLARACVGLSGAHVEQAVRGMRRRARREDRRPMLADLEAEIGRATPVPDATRHRVAIHEGGHAVVIALNRPGALRSVSVPKATLDRGTLGTVASEFGFNSAEGDRHVTREVIVNAIAEKLAGRAAEHLLLNEVSAGAGGSPTSDIAQATWIATVAVTAFGLGTDGVEPPIWKGLPSVERVPQLLAVDQTLAREVGFLMADGYATTMRLVQKHETAVEEVARALIDRETLSGEEVQRIVAGSRQ
ncbi:ATP-dependent Zn protease [Falsiroseomonas bella]|uniref:ATP-dependent Zn protease n=1 Tax=Falsiroseomonas bella TaxID=2184016 RepID=A0A317FE18_9PROT|nr:AAA family ATPase [Falsiroseomonas bella]PWS37125.1 ATP-dependent Zn protease [Falsiroseomonas bella]